MIFVDTEAWLARFLVRDQYHQRAEALWSRIEKKNELLLTSDSVFAETLSFLCKRVHPTAAEEAGRFIHDWQHLKILRASQEDEWAALDFLHKYADQEIGFVDCLSFALMRRYRIKTVFAFDWHFEMAGFHIFH